MKIPAHSPLYLRVVAGGRREAVAISPVVSLVVPAGHRRVDERVDVHAVAVHHGKVLATTSLLVSHFAVLYPCMRLLGELVTPFLNVQRECVYNKTINNGNERDDTLTYTKQTNKQNRTKPHQSNNEKENKTKLLRIYSPPIPPTTHKARPTTNKKPQTHTKQKQNEKQRITPTPTPKLKKQKNNKKTN